MKEIKVGDRFRGIISKQTATVVFTNIKYCMLEFDDKELSVTFVDKLFNSFEEIPVEKVRWFHVYAKRKDMTGAISYLNLRKSREDFIKETKANEEDFEWISLKEIEY